MSTKPGATTQPEASSVRAPARPLPTAAMRSPSIATSARRAGAPVPSTTLPPRITRSAMASLHQRVRARQALRLTGREVELERGGAVRDRVDLAVRVEVQVRAVHLEPDARVVFERLERVHGPRGLVQEGARAVHVVVLLVLPRARRRVAPHRAGVPVLLHLVAGLKDVLDDP